MSRSRLLLPHPPTSLPGGHHAGGDLRLVRDFISAIREKRPMLNDPYSARMSVAVGVAAHESIRAGGRIVEVRGPQV